jgi:hypothetical protein
VLIVDQFLPQDSLHLFNSPEFFRLHAGRSGSYFQWQIKGKARLTLHLTETAVGVYRSPARGTFGGLSCSADASMGDLVDFLAAVQTHLLGRGVRTLEILLAPMQHDLASCSSQYFVLRSMGFNESLVDLNYAMEVDTQAFAERVSYANRKRLNKCRREGYQACQVGPERLPEVYAVIAENRASKGYPITMTESLLQDMQTLFPKALELFACESDGRMLAAAICLRLTPDVLYVFYWGDLPGYAQNSPVVMLAESIYLSCQDRNIRMLDAGTSTLDMQLSHGLINFKRGLGFQESLKFRMEKRFEP